MDKIVIENGDFFEGTREQFENCYLFPDSVSDEEIKQWCVDNQLYPLVINGKTILNKPELN